MSPTYACIFIFLKFSIFLCSEFRFELADNSKACYHKILDKGVKTKLEFSVISGGNYDVDVVIIGPLSNIPIQYFKQKQSDIYEWVSPDTGTHMVCFSNEFSSFEHKSIYFDWSEADDDHYGAFDPSKVHHPLNLMEQSTEVIHDNLNQVVEYQTHYQLAEASGRIFAEELNNRVMILCLSLTLAILVIGIGQIIILRNFFTEKKPLTNSY